MVKQLMSQREEVRAEANYECVKERALWTALPVPRAGESFCQLVGKVEQLENKLLSCLLVCVSASTTALFWVESDLCFCFIHQHMLLRRLGAKKRDRSCSDADSGPPLRRAEQHDAKAGRLCSARVVVDGTMAVALQMWHISLLACSEPAVAGSSDRLQLLP